MNGLYLAGETVFNNWKITKKLGEGSYGKVYEIERNDFGETYRAALKVITVPQNEAELKGVLEEGMSQKEAEEYFYSMVQEIVREFALMARVKGTSHVVGYEDHMVIPHEGKLGWDILIRMEELTPLLTYAYAHPLSRRDIIRLGIHICEALEICQRYNIIHRDIKPENIFVSENGDFKLGDFGIARTIEKTVSGLSKKGTYSYMAPEVYRGTEYGFSVDMYSLGIVLYRMLNRNRIPFLPPAPEPITFSSREQALARRMRGEKMEPPCYGQGRLGEIVLKAAAYDPKDRYSSPAQMKQELEAILYTEEEGPIIYPEGDEIPVVENVYASSGSETYDASISVFSGGGNSGGRSDGRRSNGGGNGSGRSDGRRSNGGGNGSERGSGESSGSPKSSGASQKSASSGKALFIAVPAVLAVVAVLFLAARLLGGGSGGSAGKAAQSGSGREDAGAQSVLSGGGQDSQSGQDVAAQEESGDDSVSEGQIVADSEAVENYMLYGNHVVQHYTADSGSPFTAEQLQEVSGVGFEDKPWVTDSSGQSLHVSAVPWSFEGIEILPEKLSDADISAMAAGISSADVEENYGVRMEADTFLKFWSESIAGEYDMACLTYFDEEMKNPGRFFYLFYKIEHNNVSLCLPAVGSDGQPYMEECECCQVSRKGNHFTLSRNGSSITLVPYGQQEGAGGKMLGGATRPFVENDSQAYEGIVGLSYLSYNDDPTDEGVVYFADGSRVNSAKYDFSAEDQLTLSWDKRFVYSNGKGEEKDDPVSLTFDYLMVPEYEIMSFSENQSAKGGIILYKDGKQYLYLTDEYVYKDNKLSGTAEEIDLSALKDEQVSQMISAQTGMLGDLDKEFEEKGIDASVDSGTGQVSMDSSILFGLDVSELSDEGKAYLDGFLDVYASVVLGDAYKNYVSKIKVEGHTDSSGSYEYNQKLSEARAASVEAYCLERQPEMASIIETAGYSSDYLIYDENGNEDAAASRRVVFKLVLTPQ